MKSEAEIRGKIHRLRQMRAGSMYPKTFEAGWIYGLLWVLKEEPKMSTYELAEFIYKMPCSSEYSRSLSRRGGKI